MEMAEAIDLSAVITCYFEERSIDEFHSRLTASLSRTGLRYEIVFVNDGSTDETFAKLEEIFDRDPRVSCIVNLFRNSGQAAAITAGIREARGSNFLFMDSDLQLDPEELPRLLEEFERGADIVSGWRASRKDPFMRVFFSRIANVVMRRASRSELRDFGCTYKLFRGELVRAFPFGPEKLFNQVEIIAQAGVCREVAISHHPRRFGRSGWRLSRLFDFYMENVVNLTNRQFQALMVLNFGLALAFVARVAVGFLFPGAILSEVTHGLLLNLQVISLLLLAGTLCFMGELGIRSFRILQRNPRYVVKEIRRRSPAE
jgi:glycosyltransferase involved in cell wall biosynthesis